MNNELEQLLREKEQLELQLLEEEKAKLEKELSSESQVPQDDALAESAKYTVSGLENLIPSGRAISESLETAGKGALSAASLGVSEYPVAQLESALGGYPYEQAIARRRELQQRYPISEMVGQTAGGVVGPVAKIGGAMAGATEKGIELLAKTQAGKAVGKAAGALGEQVAGIIKGGLAGAAQAPLSAIQVESEKAAGVLKPEEAPSMTELAKFGGTVGAGLPALVSGLRGAKAVGGVMLTTALGPNKVTRQRYLQQPKEVTKLIEESEQRQLQQLEPEESFELSTDKGLPRTIVAEQIEAAVSPIKKRETELEASLSRASQAQIEAKKSFQDRVTEKQRAITEELAASKKSAAEAARIKNDMFKGGISPQFEADVRIASEKLKDDVKSLSSESYKILDATPGQADLSGIKGEIEALKDSLKTGGQLLGETNKKTARMLDRWAQDLEALAGESGMVPFRDIKKAVQDIDMDLRGKSEMANRAKFSDLERTMLLKVRRTIDSRVKEIPNYADLMESVYQKTELLQDVSNFIGKEKQTNLLAKLSQLWKPGEPGQEIISALGREVGQDFEQALSEYAAMKRVGASASEKAKALAELPEQKQLAKIQRTFELSKRKELAPLLAEQEYVQWVKSQEDLLAIENQLLAIRQDLDGIGKAATAPVNFVTGAMNGIDPQYRAQLEALRNLTGKDFEREVRAAATAEALMRPYIQGSRRTMVMKALLRPLIGFTAGASLGGSSEFAGFGALLGAMLDTQGGMVTKRLLDGYLAIKNIPTVKTINALFSEMPKELQDDLRNSFVRSVLSAERISTPVSPENIPQIAYQIQTSGALSSLEKAKAAFDLQKLNIVDTNIIKKIMLSGMESRSMGMSAQAVNFLSK